MTPSAPLTRRVLLADRGRGTAAIVVLGLPGCTPGASTISPAPLSGGESPGGGWRTGRSSSPPAAAAGSSRNPPGNGGGVAWHRVNLGFVSAYVLVRAGEAALVDTGVAGSEGAIQDALAAVGLAWDAVGHVILTHKHRDHVGSVEAVLERALAATGYAGEADIPAIASPRPLTAVADGDVVFGLMIVSTPGHTPGSVSVHDPAGGILVAGDALRTERGAAIPPNARFTEDMATATASIAKIGRLTFETLLVAHGDPIESDASTLVARLAEVH